MARKSGFGIFEAGTTTGYVAGWCPHCGRRRGSDGRCADCDPWFTSPLVQYGGPIVAGFAVFLIAGAFILAPRHNAEAGGSTSAPSGAVLATTSVTTAPSFPLNYAPQMPAVQPVAMPMPKPPDPATMTANFTPSIYTPDDRAYAEAENLRQMTAWTDYQVANIRRAEEQRQQMSNSDFGQSRGLQSATAAVQSDVL